jgi:hypothetical protein
MLQLASMPAHSDRHPHEYTALQKSRKKTDVITAAKSISARRDLTLGNGTRASV